MGARRRTQVAPGPGRPEDVFLCAKVKFLSQREAEQHIRERNLRRMHAYRCPICSVWHLTSQQPRRDS